MHGDGHLLVKIYRLLPPSLKMYRWYTGDFFFSLPPPPLSITTTPKNHTFWILCDYYHRRLIRPPLDSIYHHLFLGHSACPRTYVTYLVIHVISFFPSRAPTTNIFWYLPIIKLTIPNWLVLVLCPLKHSSYLIRHTFHPLSPHMPQLQTPCNITHSSDSPPPIDCSAEHNKGLRLAHYNVRSVLPKIDSLILWLVEINPDIVTLNETWLNPSIPSTQLSFDNYTLIRQDRTTGKKRWMPVNTSK